MRGGKRERPRGFYARGMPGRDEAGRDAPEDGVDELVRAIKARVVATLSARPEDVGVSLRSADTLLRAMLAERRLSGGDRQHLAENVQRVLDSLGSQLLPAEDQGEMPGVG